MKLSPNTFRNPLGIAFAASDIGIGLFHSLLRASFVPYLTLPYIVRNPSLTLLQRNKKYAALLEKTDQVF